MQGLLGIKTPAQTTQMLQERSSQRSESMDILTEESPSLSMLAGRIDRSWQQSRSNKTLVEVSMLDCLRDRKGEYSPEDQALINQAGGSDIFIRSTTGKIRAGIAHIKSILMPSSEKAYGITHTERPKLPKFMQDAIIDRIRSNPDFVDDQGQPMSPVDQATMLERKAKELLLMQAKQAARSHQELLFDQLQEGGWHEALSDLIDDICTYPVAFMKGPFFAQKPSLSWERTEHGWLPKSGVNTVMCFRSINPFDAYWSAGSDSVQKGDFIERLRLTRTEIYNLIGVDGYNEEAIRNVLSDHGRNGLYNWLWTDTSRLQIADHLHFWQKSTTDLDGLHWYGRAQGIELLEWGINPNDIDDPLMEYDIDAIKIGRHVIRAVLNPDPMYRRPIHSACYEDVPGNVAGNSPSMLMRSSARMINATGRALQNNLAHASGFQVDIDYTRLHEETDPFDIHPFKLWQTRESEMSGDRPAVRFFQPKSNARELMEVIQFFKQISDEDTGIPRHFQGSEGNGQGADATAKGRAMLADQSTKLLRSAIMNIDMGIIIPKLKMMYDHNMLTSDDQSIKGDCQVIARGANAMLMRDSSRQSHMAMMELTNNDVDRQIMGLAGRAKLLKAVFDTHPDIEAGVIPHEEDLEKKVAEIEAAPPPPDPAIVKVEAETQLGQQRLQAEAQKSVQDAEIKREEMANARNLELMRLKANERNAERAAQRQAEMDIQKLEQAAQFELQKLQQSRQTEIDKINAQKDVKKYEADLTSQANKENHAATIAATPVAPEQPTLSVEEIEAAVVKSVVDQVGTLKDDMMKTVDALVKQISEKGDSNGNGTFVFNFDGNGNCQPVSKTFTTERDAKGNLQGKIVPNKKDDK